MLKKILPILIITMITSCGGKTVATKDETKPQTNLVKWTPPPAGTVVDMLEERIEDPLNEKYFRVSVIAGPESAEGVFELKLEYGFNANKTDLILPQWPGGAILKPVLERGTKQYTCLVGFDIGDGAFHEYYRVVVDKEGSIRLKQTRDYVQTAPQP